MPGFADLLYLGQPDPARQLAAMLSGQQPSAAPAPGPAAQPQDPNAPAPDAQPVAANPVAPGAPPPPGSPPQPAALTSTPDMQQAYSSLANPPNLMSLYLQLQARDQAKEQINKGFALIAANHSSPAMARAIMDSVSGGDNAAGTVQNLMGLYNAQTQMAGQQSLLAQAPAIAAKLGLPEAEVRAQILAGRGDELVKAQLPTDLMRNYQQARGVLKAQGMADDDINIALQPMLTGMMGGDADTKSWQNAKRQWDLNPATKGQPYPWGTGPDDNPTRFRAWSGAQVEADKQTVADQGEAFKMGPGYRANLQGERDKLAAIIGLKGYDADGQPIIDPARHDQLEKLFGPNGNNMAQKFINAEPTKGTWDQDVASWWGNLSPEDQRLLTQIRDATNPNQRFGSGSKLVPRRTVSASNEINSGLDSIRNVTTGVDDWRSSLMTTIKAIDGATVNSFGAQGTPEAAEEYARRHGIPASQALGLMDDNYLPGGSMYPKGRASMTTMTSQQVSDATAAIKAAAKVGDDPEQERQNQIKLALSRNIDPTPLKNLKV